ncbi:MAG: succinyldiaminopimelate transaminase [Gammaproteobacteria bacterium]|nr:succinyldiaminopimelate transaminase [Gammaproteobacteria bacterium]
MNPFIKKLQPYPFERLAALKAGVTPETDKAHIALSIGEPQHAPPAFAIAELEKHMEGLAAYPQARGIPELRQAIAAWLQRRYDLGELIDPEQHVVPLTGTREGLFAFVQAAIDASKGAPAVLMPNPFYQIYEGAAYLAGAEPVYMNTTAETGFLPDFSRIDQATWQAAQIVFICTPGNPTGAVMSIEQMQELIGLADEHDFIIVSDECYAELYDEAGTPPPGLLEACKAMGRNDFKRCVVMHSLSKRSNLPGLRSGFAAGDADIIQPFIAYRTYHGCAMPLPAQHASIAAWNDDAHVSDNRRLYRQKYALAEKILGEVTELDIPSATFYLWMKTPIDAETFARKLFQQENLTTLPGSYLSRDTDSGNPGEGYLRVSLVPDLAACEDALWRIRRVIESLQVRHETRERS